MMGPEGPKPSRERAPLTVGASLFGAGGCLVGLLVSEPDYDWITVVYAGGLVLALLSLAIAAITPTVASRREPPSRSG
jgi:hypothetical protein